MYLDRLNNKLLFKPLSTFIHSYMPQWDQRKLACYKHDAVVEPFESENSKIKYILIDFNIQIDTKKNNFKLF